MQPPRHRIRLGVLVRGTAWPAWQLAALRNLVNEAGVELALVLDAGPSPGHPRVRTGDAAALPANPLAVVSAAAMLDGAPRVDVSGSAAPAIDDYGIDVIWCAEPAAVPAGFAPPVAGGIWTIAFVDGDPRSSAALLHAGTTICVRLLRLGPHLGRARRLSERHFLNEPFAPALTRARILYGCADWPARQLRAWKLQGDAALDGDEVSIAEPPRPGRLASAGLPIRQLINLGRRTLACCYKEKWAVGLVARPISAFLGDVDRSEITWLDEAPQRDYYADPFGVVSAEGPILLVEAYDDGLGRGRIDALRPGAAGRVETTRDVLPQSCHMSYPYLIEYGGDIYCVPETHQQRRIALYRGTPFPQRWSLVTTLVADFAGVDATVFQHEGRWWLLCGNQDDEPNAKLYGFFADALTGPWRPHPLNPLKCDPRSSRPAGTPFRHAGALFRPAQDSSIEYGGAVTINQVCTLSPTAYVEESVTRVSPDPAGRYPAGLHTLAALGELTLVDGKRRVFAPRAALSAGRHFLGRMFGRRSRPLSPARAAR